MRPPRRIAIVISTGFARGELRPAAALAHAARQQRCEVGVFLMDHGVEWLREAPRDLEALLDDGCDVIACASSVEVHGVAPAASEIVLGSQDDHAALVHHADRVVAFT